MAGESKRGSYHRNHYVPEWYQRRFLLPGSNEGRLFHLDLIPPTITGSGGHKWQKKALNRWGPVRCFVEDDLYTTQFGSFESTEIEEKFFGKIDTDGCRAIEYFTNFKHPSADGDAFKDILDYISIQKIRTPKGLGYLSNMSGFHDKNSLLFAMQKFQRLHNSIWTECIWQIASADSSEVKFIISDHPVTVYNRDFFPLSPLSIKMGDPDIRMTGTHTIFPLSLNRVLIMTNLSWVRNPYESALNLRPNPGLFRHAMFNFMEIQTGRVLSDLEVREINFVIKRRAKRYIAAAQEEWLHPEADLPSENWRKLGSGLLLMPDPRGVSFSSQIVVGYEGGGSAAFDEYGRRPRQPDYQDKARHEKEWRTFHRFQGEFARLYGPRRRGTSFEFHREITEDDAEYHRYMVSQERLHGGKPPETRARRSRRTK